MSISKTSGAQFSDLRNQKLFDKYYYSKPEFVDGTTQFHGLLRGFVPPTDALLLEIGSGPANPTSEFLSSCGVLYGVDVSEEVYSNQFLKQAYVFGGERLPFDDKTFDVCVSDYVLEHVSNPRTHFAEIARVLKPDGVYCFRTPNLFHYVCAGARLLPFSAHLKFANRLRGLGAEAHDPYPTVYRANRRGTIASLCRDAGLEVVKLLSIEKEPLYGRLHPMLFFPMMAYERIVNTSDLFAGFRVNILCVARKRAER